MTPVILIQPRTIRRSTTTVIRIILIATGQATAAQRYASAPATRHITMGTNLRGALGLTHRCRPAIAGGAAALKSPGRRQFLPYLNIACRVGAAGRSVARNFLALFSSR